MISSRYFMKNSKYCLCQTPELIENYDKAIADHDRVWACHHRDEIRVLPSGMIAHRSMAELIENGRYYNCPPNELIFLTPEEHATVHHKNKVISKETRQKMTESRKRKVHSDFGRKFMEHYQTNKWDNPRLYKNELSWYHNHGHKCRWE